MAERLWTPRLVASIISIAIVISIGWIFVYYYALESLLTKGGTELQKVFSNINLGSAPWWRDFLSLAFDVLIVVVAFIGTWWVLGHLALEAAEAGKWRKYYSSPQAKEDTWITRFTAWQRVQHIWIMLTFIICAYTGLALNLGLFTERALYLAIHVYSGLAMGILVILHFTQYLVEAIIAKAKGESLRERFAMLEFYSFKFIRNFFKSLAHTISTKIKPEPYGKYNPEQLFEYWGVYWGIAVLGIPGLIMALYGPGPFEGLLWVMHTKEAILAITFLLIVHLGYTHFRPKVFPMDPTFLNGKMPMKRIKEEHPAWADQLLKQKKAMTAAQQVVQIKRES